MARISPVEYRYEVWAKKFDVVNESKFFPGQRMRVMNFFTATLFHTGEMKRKAKLEMIHNLIIILF